MKNRSAKNFLRAPAPQPGDQAAVNLFISREAREKSPDDLPSNDARKGRARARLALPTLAALRRQFDHRTVGGSAAGGSCGVEIACLVEHDAPQGNLAVAAIEGDENRLGAVRG